MSRAFARPSQWLPASFYRGGTSRGLVMRDAVLTPYSQADRDRILCQASSPDPDARQIDGLGGGTSSTSKVAIVSKDIRQAVIARQQGNPFPGLERIEDKDQPDGICDVVYRAGQVSIRQQSIDWSSTCGNMMAAVAHYALSSLRLKKPIGLPGIIDPQDDTKYSWPVRIMAHDTGKVFTAHVPVEVTDYTGSEMKNARNSLWYRPSRHADAQISGVPGTAPGIVIESPLIGSVLPTGNERDTIQIDGKQIDVTIIDTGLPVVFVSAKSLDIPSSSLLEHPASIDSNIELMATLEQVRKRACALASSLRLSAPSPKLCVVHPRCEYTSTGGQKIVEDSMDLVIRTVSTGQLHRTVPATTLSALAASTCFGNSIIAEIMVGSSPCKTTQAAMSGDVRAITVGQPAGCSTAMAKVVDGLPSSILMTRTARLIMDGSIPVDPELDMNSKIV